MGRALRTQPHARVMCTSSGRCRSPTSLAFKRLAIALAPRPTPGRSDSPAPTSARRSFSSAGGWLGSVHIFRVKVQSPISAPAASDARPRLAGRDHGLHHGAGTRTPSAPKTGWPGQHGKRTNEHALQKNLLMENSWGDPGLMRNLFVRAAGLGGGEVECPLVAPARRFRRDVPPC